jgi:predicted transcriptional regulator
MFIYISMETTTVLLKKSLKRRLEALKTNPRESINSVVERLANMATDNEPLSRDEIEGIRRSLKDIEAGRIYKMKDVAKEMGLK